MRERIGGAGRMFAAVAAATVVALLAAGCAAEAQELSQSPNILFVLTDDQPAATVEVMSSRAPFARGSSTPCSSWGSSSGSSGCLLSSLERPAEPQNWLLAIAC